MGLWSNLGPHMSHPIPRSTKNLRTILPASLLLLLAASTGHAASYSGPLNKGEWATDVPSYIDMFIAVPDTMPEKPPILVNIHSCGNTAGGRIQGGTRPGWRTSGLLG